MTHPRVGEVGPHRPAMPISAGKASCGIMMVLYIGEVSSGSQASTV